MIGLPQYSGQVTSIRVDTSQQTPVQIPVEKLGLKRYRSHYKQQVNHEGSYPATIRLSTMLWLVG